MSNDYDAEVTAAEEQAQEAEALAGSLEAAVLDGDTTITHEELTKQKSLVEFLRLQVRGAKDKAARAALDRRTQAIRALVSEIRKAVPESGTKLASALEQVDKAARAFFALSEEYDVMLEGWRQRVHQFQIAEGRREEGIGLNGIGQLVLDDSTFELADGGRFLNLLFAGGDPYGKLTPGGEDRRAEAIKALRAIGDLK